MFRISGSITFWDPSWGLRHWRPEFSYRYNGILICFTILILRTLCGKTIMGRQKVLLCWFLFFGGALIVGGWRVMGWCRSSFIGPAEVASFSTRDFSRSSKHDTLTCSIDWIFLRFILMSHSYYRFSSLRPSFVYYYFYCQQPCK